MYYVASETNVLRSFNAANPWNKGLTNEFNVCVHYRGGAVPAHAAFDKRSRVQGYFIYSTFDKKYRPIQDALVKLWLDGKVLTHQLPELLFHVQSRPEKKDITPHLTLTATQRTVKVVGIVLLGAIIACLGWLLYKEGLVWGPALSVAGILFSAWYLVRLQRMNARRRTLTTWILAQLQAMPSPIHQQH